MLSAVLTYLEPSDDLPSRMPSPFGEPCPVARRAAERMVAELPDALRREGKMFGVLVVREQCGARIGFLRAFSGMVDGRWLIDGFVPPTFDLAARDAFWVEGEAELIAIADRIAAVDLALAPLREQLAKLRAAHAVELGALREKHAAAKSKRDEIRRSDPTQHAALARQSARETEEKRDIVRRQRDREREVTDAIAPLDVKRRELDDRRADRSRQYLVRIHGTYSLPNAAGEERPLRDIFAPAEPPGGAGDCAAPKLLAYAYRHGLVPIALAEVWVGPDVGGRRDGHFYPACRGKCGPILAHMLDGLDADEAPQFGGGPIDASEPKTLFEDRWLVIVDKPVSLLSVPGRAGALRDSVLSRLRERYPDATGPVVVHRLDLDTSGLLLAAKDEATHKALQRLFAVREISKRYIAWLDGEVSGDRGTIDLPLRVDLDDRPRQIVDSVHGKAAVTEWEVLARDGGRTRVAFSPKTGRAHQLRVHSAVGLGAPIVGDRLYGRPDKRLMLHAEQLAFVHPHTGERVVVTRSAPF